MGVHMMRACLALSLCLLACGEGTPLEEQALDEVLAASPEEVADLPPAAGQRLRARLEEARTRAEESFRVAAPADPSPAAALQAATAGRPPMPCALVRREGQELAVRTLADPPWGPEGPALPALEGPAAEGSAEAEGRALAASGGALLRTLLREGGARRLVRVVGWPIGAAAFDGVVYVNGAWLAALSYEVPAPEGPVDRSSDPLFLGNSSYSCHGTCADLSDGVLGTACKNYCDSSKCSVSAARRGPLHSLRVLGWLLSPLLVLLWFQRRRWP